MTSPCQDVRHFTGILGIKLRFLVFAKKTFYQLSYLPTLRKIFVVAAAVLGFFSFSFLRMKVGRMRRLWKAVRLSEWLGTWQRSDNQRRVLKDCWWDWAFPWLQNKTEPPQTTHAKCVWGTVGWRPPAQEWGELGVNHGLLRWPEDQTSQFGSQPSSLSFIPTLRPPTTS